MNEAMQGVLRRVQKLLAIAEDTRANPAEAAAAAEMAEKIMRKHQIEMGDLIAKDLRKKDACVRKPVSVVMKRNLAGTRGEHKASKVPPWANWLAYSVAKLNDCEIRFGWNPAMGKCIDFFGYEADVEVATYMFDYLANAMINGVRAEQKKRSEPSNWRGPMSKAESESFRRGFVSALCGSLGKMRREKEAEMQATVASRGLVVLKSTALVEQFGEFTYGQAKVQTISSTDAYSAGVSAGSKVDVARRGVGHSTVDTKRLA